MKAPACTLRGSLMRRWKQPKRRSKRAGPAKPLDASSISRCPLTVRTRLLWVIKNLQQEQLQISTRQLRWGIPSRHACCAALRPNGVRGSLCQKSADSKVLHRTLMSSRVIPGASAFRTSAPLQVWVSICEHVKATKFKLCCNQLENAESSESYLTPLSGSAGSSAPCRQTFDIGGIEALNMSASRLEHLA